MNRNPLNAETREAIRTFIRYEVLPAGIILAVISFVVGYFIKEVATGKAYVESVDRIYALEAETKNALQEAKNIRDQTDARSTEMKALVDNLNREVVAKLSRISVSSTDLRFRCGPVDFAMQNDNNLVCYKTGTNILVWSHR